MHFSDILIDKLDLSRTEYSSYCLADCAGRAGLLLSTIVKRKNEERINKERKEKG